jgi:hypothetical protein
MRGVFGLDQQIASLASGTPAVALAVALLLGLRHPLDPDHLAAVGAMSRSSRGRSALVGLSWGVGHATTIVLLGAPVVLWAAALPLGVHRGIEALIGVAILALGVRLSVRGARESHVHRHPRPRRLREAYAVGVLHGAGGSAGIGLLILSAIPETGVALAALVIFAASTALAMGAVAAGLGRGLRALPARSVAAVVSAFGLWYLLAAVVGAPYPF